MTPVWTVLRVNPYRARATVDGVAVEVWKQDAVRDLPAGYLPGIALTPGTRSWPNGVRRLLRLRPRARALLLFGHCVSWFRLCGHRLALQVQMLPAWVAVTALFVLTPVARPSRT